MGDETFQQVSASTLVDLGRARELLGKSSVAALEHVVRSYPDLSRIPLLPTPVTPEYGKGSAYDGAEMVGVASYVVGYLQRCDSADAAITAAVRSSRAQENRP